MMTQEEAMNMTKEDAVQVLKPLQMMMLDRNGCPISDAYFALGKAIESLTADVAQVLRCEKCRHWNSETHGCNRNPSVEAWNASDWCSYGEKDE